MSATDDAIKPINGNTMKILFAADGSTFTKKALTFLVSNKNILGPGDELVVLHVQDAISALVEKKLGSAEVTAYRPNRQTPY